MADITLNLDGDLGDLLKGMRETRSELAEIKSAMAGAKKDMQDAFQAPAKDLEKLTDELKNAKKANDDLRATQQQQRQTLEALKQKISEFEKAQTQAYDPAVIAKYQNKLKDAEAEIESLRQKVTELEKVQQNGFDSSVMNQYQESIKASEAEIDNLKQKITELEQLQSNSEAPIGTEDQIKKIKDYQAELDQLKTKIKQSGSSALPDSMGPTDTLKAYIATMDIAREKLAGMTEGTKEYKALSAEISAVEIASKGLIVAVDEEGNAVGGVRAELLAYKKTLEDLKAAGLDQTQMYESLKNEAGELANAIKNANEEIRESGSETPGLDKAVRGVNLLVNSYGILQGVSALVGKENKDMQEVLVRLNAVLLITNSLQQVMNELKKQDSVITSIQIGLQKAYALVVGETTGAVKLLRLALASTGIGLLIILLAEAANAMNLFGDATDEAAEAQKRLKEEVDLLNSSLNVQKDFFAREEKIEIARAKARGASEKEIFDIQQKYRDLNYVATADAYKKVSKLDEIEGAKLMNSLKDQNANMLVAYYDYTTKQNDERKRAAEKAQKERERAAKKVVEDIKRQNQMLLQLQGQYYELRAKSLGDSWKAELQKLTDEFDKQQNVYKTKYAEINDQIAKGIGDPKKAAAIRKTIQDSMNLGTQVYLAGVTKLTTDTWEKVHTDLLAVSLETNEALKKQEEAALQASGQKYDQIVDRIKKNSKDIENFNAMASAANDVLEKLGSPSRIVLIPEEEVQANNDRIINLEKQRIREQYDIRAKFANDAIDIQEDLKNKTIDIMHDGTLSEEAETKLKEQLKINIEKTAAREKLKNLLQYQLDAGEITKDTFNKLFDPESYIQATKKKISIFDLLGIQISDPELKKKIEQLLQQAMPTKVPNLWAALGFDAAGQAKAESIIKGITKVADSFGQAFGEIAQLYDTQIQKRQQNIQVIDDEISKQEDAVSKEKDLADQGYANDLDLEEKKLVDLQEQKKREQQLLDEANKKKQALQKAQLLADSIAQISNLITAASEIWSTSAVFGPIAGPILAAAATAAMFIGFTAAKVSAWSAINQQTAEKGRRVSKGKSHSDGGNKYISLDNNDPELLEIQVGEWVVNQSSSKKYDPILSAINADTLDDMPRAEIRKLLEPYGIHLHDDVTKNVVVQHDKTQQVQNVVVVNNPDDSQQWEKQNKLLKELGKPQKTVEYTPTHRIEKQGNHVRKIKLKKDVVDSE